jgi:hypothetical protein
MCIFLARAAWLAPSHPATNKQSPAVIVDFAGVSFSLDVVMRTAQPILPDVRDQFLVRSLRRSPAGNSVTAMFTELVPSAAKTVM